MKKCMLITLLVTLMAPTVIYASTASMLIKAGDSTWTCEGQASNDGYKNWFAQKGICLQADASSPYTGFIGGCKSPTNCISIGQLGVATLTAGWSAKGGALAISSDGHSNWTIINGIPNNGPAVVTFDASGAIKAFNPATCECTPGSDPIVPDGYSCKINNKPGHYINCIPGITRKK